MARLRLLLSPDLSLLQDLKSMVDAERRGKGPAYDDNYAMSIANSKRFKVSLLVLRHLRAFNLSLCSFC